ncbi:hypothetical protein [Streptomyces sp. NPDC006551]|uniref:hypothetical protein n=1 Tax=Streptomyces sp. NPDC006551 TaxID=3157178 RepID=UPI0033B5D9D8
MTLPSTPRSTRASSWELSIPRTTARFRSQEAHRKALPKEDLKTPLAEKPYSLRHAGVSLWIKAGVDPVEVTRRAGHSIAVLWRFCAKILRGRQHKANELIGAALDA